MLDKALLLVASLVVAAWGVAHLVPTRSVVASFGTISVDNRRVLTMEWVAEGLTMLFVGVLVAAVTLIDGGNDAVAVLVDRLAAGLLAGIAVLTAVTGARTAVIWFRACPYVLAVCIALLLLGSWR